MTGSVSMIIILSDGQQVRHHIDHVRARGCEEVVPVTSEDEVFTRGTLDTSEVVPAEPDPQALPEPVPDAPAEPTVKPTEAPEPVVLRRSIRVHRPPDRLKLELIGEECSICDLWTIPPAHVQETG